VNDHVDSSVALDGVSQDLAVGASCLAQVVELPGIGPANPRDWTGESARSDRRIREIRLANPRVNQV
jgi:hypothetical protein